MWMPIQSCMSGVPEKGRVGRNRDEDGLLARGTLAFDDGNFQTLLAGVEAQTQGGGAALPQGLLRTPKDKQGFALSCRQMQSSQASRVYAGYPAEQRGAGVVPEYLLAGPKGIASCFGLHP